MSAHAPPPQRQQYVPDRDSDTATVIRQGGDVAHNAHQEAPQLGLRLLVHASRHALHTCRRRAPLHLMEQVDAPGKVLGETSAIADYDLAIVSTAMAAPLTCAGIT